MDFLEFQCRTRIVYQEGVLEEVGVQLANLEAKRCFVVADPICAEMGWQEKLEQSLKDAGVKLIGWFDEVPGNSEIKIVKQCAEAAKTAQTDSFLAIGGGSTLDTMKCANILVKEGGDLLGDHQGAYTLQQPLLPMVGMPTTAGTGSEVSFAAVIRDAEQKLKISFFSPFLATSVAVLDPLLTLGLPRFLTAATGMDALTHAIEAIHSVEHQPYTDAFALHAIRLIAGSLQKVTDEPKDVEARGTMLQASCMAGIAFSNALVGIVHAMAHAAGGIFNAHHGALNALFLPLGMEFNLTACADRYKLVAEALGLPVHGLEAKEASEMAIAWIREKNKALGLPARLQELGISETDLDRLAEDTLSDGAILTNPREATEEEVKAIFQRAFL